MLIIDDLRSIVTPINFISSNYLIIIENIKYDYLNFPSIDGFISILCIV